MSDNPFAEPGDDDRTVIRTLGRPGSAVTPGVGVTPVGAQAAREAVKPGPAATQRRPPAAAAPVGPEEVLPVGMSPVLDAAAPLLALLGHVRNVVSPPDPAALRGRAIEGLRRFEDKLRAAKLPIELIRAGHYALCASLDDVVRSMPWGWSGPWADASLVSTFHGEVRSGERFFEVLAQLRREAARYLPVIELMYVCIALGMQGRYRLSPRGPAELDRVREETYAVIARARPPVERALSPHWQGVAAPYRPLRPILPVWVAAIGCAGLICLAYVLLEFSLNDASDRMFAAALALPPDHAPAIVRAPVPAAPPPAPLPAPPSGELAKLTAGLQAEIGQGLVSIHGTETAPVIRIAAAGMFASGSATIEPRFLPLLARVGMVLGGEEGGIDVIGYTDNQPIRTVRFPSNFQLSGARARTAADALGGGIASSRLATEGRADADPIAPNTNEAGRQQNRRIEIVLRRPGAA